MIYYPFMTLSSGSNQGFFIIHSVLAYFSVTRRTVGSVEKHNQLFVMNLFSKSDFLSVSFVDMAI